MPDANFKELIQNLRMKMEECVKNLKKLEETGTEDDANKAIWTAYGGWCGDEYIKLENALRERGHKSI